MARPRLAIVLSTTVVALCARIGSAGDRERTVGINVVLSRPASGAILEDLGAYGQVLEVLPQIRAVTLRAPASDLPAIRALAGVVAANEDVRAYAAGAAVAPPDFAAGSNVWNLDAVDVTDEGGGRTVAYDGEGVYVAVVDSGLPSNWREYYPEERIATDLARAFGGGGGERGTVSSQPDGWERDLFGHGNAVTSVVLGFRYQGPEDLPSELNGVAPKATVIPVRVLRNDGFTWASTSARAFVYVTDLKRSGALGGAPVVINFSVGGPVLEVMWKAAIDYAVAHGVVVVASAGNEGAAGMTWPAAYPPVVSAGNAGWAGVFPEDDPTRISWILRDVPEGDASAIFLVPDSSRALAGQDLDLVAPGFPIAVPFTNQGRVDYDFVSGSSFAGPHVAGVVALMLQKNPNLGAADVERTLERSAMPLPPGCAEVTVPFVGPGDDPTWSDHDNVSFLRVTWCWGADATGSGLLQADAALAATPAP